MTSLEPSGGGGGPGGGPGGNDPGKNPYNHDADAWRARKEAIGQGKSGKGQGKQVAHQRANQTWQAPPAPQHDAFFFRSTSMHYNSQQNDPACSSASSASAESEIGPTGLVSVQRIPGVSIQSLAEEIYNFCDSQFVVEMQKERPDKGTFTIAVFVPDDTGSQASADDDAYGSGQTGQAGNRMVIMKIRLWRKTGKKTGAGGDGGGPPDDDDSDAGDADDEKARKERELRELEERERAAKKKKAEEDRRKAEAEQNGHVDPEAVRSIGDEAVLQRAGTSDPFLQAPGADLEGNQVVVEVEHRDGCAVAFGRVYREMREFLFPQLRLKAVRLNSDGQPMESDIDSQVELSALEFGDLLGSGGLGAVDEVPSEDEAGFVTTAAEWRQLLRSAAANGYTCEGVESMCSIAGSHAPDTLGPLAEVLKEYDVLGALLHRLKDTQYGNPKASRATLNHSLLGLGSSIGQPSAGFASQVSMTSSVNLGLGGTGSAGLGRADRDRMESPRSRASDLGADLGDTPPQAGFSPLDDTPNDLEGTPPPGASKSASASADPSALGRALGQSGHHAAARPGASLAALFSLGNLLTHMSRSAEPADIRRCAALCPAILEIVKRLCQDASKAKDDEKTPHPKDPAPAAGADPSKKGRAPWFTVLSALSEALNNVLEGAVRVAEMDEDEADSVACKNVVHDMTQALATSWPSIPAAAAQSADAFSSKPSQDAGGGAPPAASFTANRRAAAVAALARVRETLEDWSMNQ